MTKKYLEKTLKTWKNHGKIMEFCWSAAVGTLVQSFPKLAILEFNTRIFWVERAVCSTLVVISQTIRLVSQKRLTSEARISLFIAPSSGSGSDNQSGVSHHIPPLPGGITTPDLKGK